MKCSLGISHSLEETSSHSLSVVFLYFFALIAEEGFLLFPCYSLKLSIQMSIPFLFSFAFSFSSQLFLKPPQPFLLFAFLFLVDGLDHFVLYNVTSSMLKLKSGNDPCLERKQATSRPGLTETTGWPADGAAEQATAGAVNSLALQDCLTDPLRRMSSINNTASQLSHWGRASPFLIFFSSTSFFSFINVFFVVSKQNKTKHKKTSHGLSPAPFLQGMVEYLCEQAGACRLFTQKEVSCFPHWLREARANDDVLAVIKIKHFLEPL